MATDERNTVVRDANPSCPEWINLRCGVSILVRWHGAGHEKVLLTFRIPKGIDVPVEAKEGRA
jgi:hypothetical protein